MARYEFGIDDADEFADAYSLFKVAKEELKAAENEIQRLESELRIWNRRLESAKENNAKCSLALGKFTKLELRDCK